MILLCRAYPLDQFRYLNFALIIKVRNCQLSLLVSTSMLHVIYRIFYFKMTLLNTDVIGRTIASSFKSQRTVSRHDIQVNSLLSFVLVSSRCSWKHVCVYRSSKGWVLSAVFCSGSCLFMEVELWSCHMRMESLTLFSTLNICKYTKTSR